LIRINKLSKEANLQCELLAKCEYFNAGGSVKDRIGLRMIEDAETQGRIKPGDTLIEPTSGNTGIGLALGAALKGYRMIITLPEKMSQEKVDVLKALGAEIIRTPTEAAFDSPESHIGVAKRLQKEIPNSHILDQYNNPSNPLAHYDTTAEEIWEACEGKVDMVIATAGTGGTISGIARKLREKNPNIIMVGVDPKGSILAEPESLNNEKRLQSYLVEGIGYDFIPNVLERKLIDFWVKTDDRESFITARRLIKEEGLLVGGSSGSAMAGALQACKQLGPGKRAVVILADSIRNYMSKFLDDSYLWKHGFSDESHGIGVREKSQAWWSNKTVGDLQLPTPVSVTPAVSCTQAVELLKQLGFDQLPVVGNWNEILGVITESQLASKLMGGRVKPEDSVTKAMYNQFQKVSIDTTLGELASFFDRDHFAVCVAKQVTYNGVEDVVEKSIVFGVVSRIDLLKFITVNTQN
jgi:cystathionine beta-synthase